ncbi:hypothetical protein [Actinoplanes sp. NPDC051851]|uniref:hypothetical protein n=1 Tax=Actinoplanes sp. NPDC051851 TaxID=3154753 RepID=UPI003417EA63
MQPNQPPLSGHHIGAQQQRVQGWRDDLLTFLDKAKPVADRVFANNPQAATDFRNAAENYRILREGRQNYLSLTESEQRHFGGLQQNYRAVYGQLGTQLGNLDMAARQSYVSREDGQVLTGLARQAGFVNALPMYERALLESRLAVGTAVKAEQDMAGIAAANQDPVHQATQGAAIAIALQKTRDKSARIDPSTPDPMGGRVYSDIQQLKIENAQSAVALQRFQYGHCGDILSDATERFNLKLGGIAPNGAPTSRGGDTMAEIDLKESDHGAPRMNHVLLRIGPENEPESMVYCNWTRQAIMAPYHQLTVANLHLYEHQEPRKADGYNWIQVAQRYTDGPKLQEIADRPLAPYTPAPQDIHNVTHGTLRQTGPGNELSAHGMSGTMATGFQPNPALLAHASPAVQARMAMTPAFPMTAPNPDPGYQMAGQPPVQGYPMTGPPQGYPMAAPQGHPMAAPQGHPMAAPQGYPMAAQNPAAQFAGNWQHSGPQYAPGPGNAPQGQGGYSAPPPPGWAPGGAPGGAPGYGR